jgi:FkbM family methyltransferase
MNDDNQEYRIYDQLVNGVGPWAWPAWDTVSFDILSNDWVGLRETIERNVKDSSVCVQAGGNQGMYPILLAQMFSQVYTFEPNETNWRALNYNLKNLNINNVSAKFAGLGAYQDVGTCDDATNGNAGTSTLKAGKGSVDITTIDNMRLEKCDLIMLDVEGFEMKALVGAMETVEKFKPMIIAEGPERNNDVVTGILEQIGYELVDMTGTANDTVYVYTGRQSPVRSGGLPFVPKQKQKKILIAIPTAKNIEVETFKSIHDLVVPMGYTTEFQYFYGYRIDQIRNLIADWMVKGDYDYLFSVDSDITFPADTLDRFINHDQDMVTGVYRQRKAEQIIEIYNGMGHNVAWHELSMAATASENHLIEVGGCGFGCVLIKKEVFTDIPYPHFEYHVSLNHNNTISEDVDFCRKATDKGFTIWCDTQIQCGHIGQYDFRIQDL